MLGVVTYIFKDVLKEAAPVTTTLSTVVGIFARVLGAYFGFKGSNDPFDKALRELTETNNRAGRALAKLDLNDGKRVTG